MKTGQRLMLSTTSERLRSFVLCAVLAACLLGRSYPAAGQAAPPIQTYPTPNYPGQALPSSGQAIPTLVTSAQPVAALAPTAVTIAQPIFGDTTGLALASGVTQGALAPPLYPPLVGATPTGVGALSLGPFLLYPTLALSTAYNHNIYSSPTLPLSGPVLNIAPSILADYNTGIFDTALYANINSSLYPTLDPLNNAFNWQAGFKETYSPLRDLVFNVTGNYAHSWSAFATTNSLPTPVISPANPLLPGAAGVVAITQTVVNPNDTATATANVYKEFNRAFVNLGGTIAKTQYENSPASNYNMESFYGNGGIWLTPLLYAFADGVDAATNPATGPGTTSFRARTGVGTAPIGLFRGSIYYGRQGSEVTSGGTAGGPIYGGLISYFPTAVWNIDLTVDEVTNISNIIAAPAAGGALGGLPFVGAAVGINNSVQVSTVALKSNYVFSPQTSIFGVLSASRLAFLGTPRVDNARFATVGVTQTLTSNLTLTGTLTYNTYRSPEPAVSFTNYLISLGAVYGF